MARTALFVIDIQGDLALNPQTAIPAAGRVRDAGTSVLATTRANIEKAQQDKRDSDIMIVFVQHEEKPEDGALVRGSVPWELVFKPKEGSTQERVVAKSSPSTFKSNRDLADQLRAQGVEEIVAFGIQSDCCVQATCEGALAANFKVTLLSGAHSTYPGKGRSAEEIERDVEKHLGDLGVRLIAWEEWKP